MPSARSPAGLAKRAVWICPTCDPVDWPGRIALTTPSLPTVMSSAPLGIEIAGSSGMPSDVTMRDWLSSLKAPARVKAVVPSGSVTWKKPVPSTAMSSALPVCV